MGKTVCSSAAAIHLAEEGWKTLLASTDPAHSLSDGFGQPLGDEPREVEGAHGLEAIEIDAEKALERFRREYGEAVRDILMTGTYLDEEDVSDVRSLSIPGLDEVMGLKRIMDFVEEERYDQYVLDTAPTGHALRLLFLPKLLDEWVKVLAKIRWKYYRVVRGLAGREPPDGTEDFLFAMKKAVKRTSSLLRDPARTTFVVVTIPERMALEESRRLHGQLKRHGVPVGHMVVNKLVPDCGRACLFCREIRRHQEACLHDVRGGFPGLDITLVEQEAAEIRGVPQLKKLASRLFP